MKRMLKALLVTTLIACLAFSMAAPAFADVLSMTRQAAEDALEDEVLDDDELEEVSASEIRYEHTRQFTEGLDMIDLDWEYHGLDDEDYELITVEDYFIDDDEEEHEYVIQVFFEDDETSIGLRIWNAIDFDEEDYADVILLCNDINYAFRYFKTFVDDTDNSVTIAADLLVDEDQDVTVQSLNLIVMTEMFMTEVGPYLLDYAI